MLRRLYFPPSRTSLLRGLQEQQHGAQPSGNGICTGGNKTSGNGSGTGGNKISAIQQAHERPVIAADAPKAEKAQDVKPKQQLVSGRQGRPAAVDAVGMAQVSGGTARKPAAQPHERPAVAQTDARRTYEATGQAECRIGKTVRPRGKPQAGCGRPSGSSTGEKCCASTGQTGYGAPVVTAAPKVPEMKNQVPKPAR